MNPRSNSARCGTGKATTRLRLLIVVAALAMFAGHPGEAAGAADPPVDLAELSLEQLMNVRVEKVFGASRYEQRVTEAPAAVTLVTAAEIATYGHRTLADVLRSVRGLYVANDSNYSYLGVRGFLRPGDYNSRTLALVDGHRMNENVYDSANYGRESSLDVDEIDRVEVIRGPSSSLYGSSAFFGVINIVTRTGRQLDGWELAGESGSFGSAQGRVSFGRLFERDIEVLFSASYYRSDGRAAIYYPEFDPRISAEPRAANNGMAEGADAEDAFKLRGSVRYGDLTFSGLFSTRDKTVPTASFGSVFNSDLQRTSDSRGFLDVRYERELRPELRLLGRMTYDSYSYHGDYPYDYAGPDGPPEIVINKDRAFGEWLGTEWQVTATLLERHTLIAGIEYRENVRQRQANHDDVEPRFVYLDDDRSSRVAGVYAQADVELGPDVHLNAGLRYDHYLGSFGGTLNPRVGLIYSAGPRTTVKGLFGQAFRAPNAYEQFYYFDRAPVPLIPEKIQTYELLFEHYFTGDYRLSASAYQYRVQHLISQSLLPDGNIYLANVDRYSARGVEIEAEAGLGGGLHFRTSYALQRVRDEVTGQELTASPRHLAKLNLAQPFLKDRLTAGLELHYYGSVRTLAGSMADDFLLCNFTLTAHRLPGRLELSTSIYNLLDTKYGYPGSEDHAQDLIPQEGRSVQVKVSCRF